MMDEEKAYEKLVAWCSIAEHCEGEAVDKLMKWGVNPDEQSRILTKLKLKDYLNEERYCAAFVHDKFKLQKWGRRKIAEELRLKKVSRGSVVDAMLAIDSDEYGQMLLSILRSKRRSIHGADERDCRQKLFRFAMSRGFESAIIREYLDPEGILEEDDDSLI
ncbi:MAG: regulatory protein RecX [Bacteroidaceae bacterium]